VPPELELLVTPPEELLPFAEVPPLEELDVLEPVIVPLELEVELPAVRELTVTEAVVGVLKLAPPAIDVRWNPNVLPRELRLNTGTTTVRADVSPSFHTNEPLLGE